MDLHSAQLSDENPSLTPFCENELTNFCHAEPPKFELSIHVEESGTSSKDYNR